MVTQYKKRLKTERFFVILVILNLTNVKIDITYEEINKKCHIVKKRY